MKISFKDSPKTICIGISKTNTSRSFKLEKNKRNISKKCGFWKNNLVLKAQNGIHAATSIYYLKGLSLVVLVSIAEIPVGTHNDLITPYQLKMVDCTIYMVIWKVQFSKSD